MPVGTLVESSARTGHHGPVDVVTPIGIAGVVPQDELDRWPEAVD
jgi:hypothetical protein